jgi:hypothetical protein
MNLKISLTAVVLSLVFLGSTSPASAQLDHYKCYKIKKDVTPFPLTATLTDQFGTDTVNIKKLRFFCTPVDKNGSSITNQTDHFSCYQIKGASLDPAPHVVTTNQFGGSRLFAKKPYLLCVPGSKDLIP